MQKLFGLLVIIGLVWFALSVYTGDGRGSVDLGSWLEPIDSPYNSGGDEPQFSQPNLSGDDSAPSSRRSHWNTKNQRSGKTGRTSRTNAETLPQSMKRRVSDSMQKSYDRAGGSN